MFSLDRVQFPFPITHLVALAVANNMLVFVMDSGTSATGKDAASHQKIYRIDLGKSDAIAESDLTVRQKGDRIKNIFLDPTAKHLLITTTLGDNYYLYEKWKKPRILSKFRGILVESVAWGRPRSVMAESTGVMLVGSQQGHIFEAEIHPTEEFFKREERYFRQVYSLHEGAMPICSVRYEQFPADPKKYVVFVATPMRLYQFIGTAAEAEADKSMFGDLFRMYDLHSANFQEMPGVLTRSEVQFWSPFVQDSGYPSLPKTFAWMTAAGLYCGDMSFGSQSIGDSLTNNAQLLPYPQGTKREEHGSPSDQPYPTSDYPLSINVTEFHYLLLYNHSLKGINILTSEVDFEEQIPLEFDEVVQKITVDVAKSTYWVFTNLALYELIITDEDRDVWKVYLNRKAFDAALSYAKTPAQKDQIITARAEYYYTQQRYILSATYYAQSISLSFEEIVLKFIAKDEREALKHYLQKKLERLRSQDATQITLLSTWLVEIFINKLNVLRDEIVDAAQSVEALTKAANTDESLEEARSLKQRLEEEERLAIDDFRQFIRKYNSRLDKETTTKIIASHGRTQELLFYLELIGDYDRVISHWVQEKEWLTALEVLSRQSSVEFYYKYSPVLMQQAPFETVNAWIRQPNINPRHLVPALLKYDASRSAGLRGNEGQNQAIRYLQYVTQNLHNTDPAVHNYLLSLYISQSNPQDQSSLLAFLTSQKEDPHYDLQYALRLCSQHGLTQACVHLYGAMNLHEQAVELALKFNDLELAEINANKPHPDDEILRKKLWLRIARHIIEEQKDIKQALSFLSQTSDLLKIEDILPLFPDFVLIDDFKDEICNALEQYNEHIEELKTEMEEATRSAESIRLDIRELRNRYTAIPVTEVCSICRKPLLTRQFYVFPCEHVYHADCLTKLIVKECTPAKAKRIQDLQERLTAEIAARRATVQEDTGSMLASAMLGIRRARGGVGTDVGSEGDKQGISGAISTGVVSTNRGTPEKIKEDLDELVASECPLCGDLMIKSIDKPFVGPDENEVVQSWSLML
ncbi:Pep3/Vps18/deep orange family-domain-containing protein [Phlyctochytrium arcticum]|nr:Pep3/Vps18/deep orange family-domain-containing protein [Phlyctochytrium arcticum]